MSATKDKKTGKWISRFYYTDSSGERKQFFKRGFETKKAALDFEREFLAKAEFKLSMSFAQLVELYLEDTKYRVKETTFNLRKKVINQRILTKFDKQVITDITPADIRTFQNTLIDKNYSPTYLKLIHSILSSIFNFAVKFYELKENPCHKAGSIGKTKTQMSIWTLEEFKKVILECREKRFDIYTILNLLFFTGMRIGELKALTYSDIDFENNLIKINKTLVRIHGEDCVTSPKTESSNREVLIDENLSAILKEYCTKIYGLDENTRLFPLDETNIRKLIKSFAKKAGVKEIRVHDLRHSHASLLIYLGVNPLAVSKRLGHENLETTLKVYAHLYQDSAKKIVELLSNL